MKWGGRYLKFEGQVGGVKLPRTVEKEWTQEIQNALGSSEPLSSGYEPQRWITGTVDPNRY